MTISVDLDEIVVPVAHADHALIFGRRPDHPSAPVFGVDAGSVMHHGAVDLELHTLGHIGGSRLERAVEEDAAVAIPHALEAERKLKVFVVFFGLQVSVVLGEAFAVDRAILDHPALVAYFRPSVQVVAGEIAGSSRSRGASPFPGLWRPKEQLS